MRTSRDVLTFPYQGELMNTEAIVEALDNEITRLEQVKALLSSSTRTHSQAVKIEGREARRASWQVQDRRHCGVMLW
jgi:hypothetical protein